MAEYIERGSLLKRACIGMTRVCDTEWQKGYWDGVDDMAGYIREQPTTDVVEVVRCKECQQWRRNIGFVDSPNGHCFYHAIDTNSYDYCSYGERKG